MRIFGIFLSLFLLVCPATLERGARYQPTKGGECQYIKLTNVEKNQGCHSGTKFVVKPMKGMRKQFLIVNDEPLLVFVKKNQKFSDCQSFQEITSSVSCKTVPNLASVDLTKKPGSPLPSSKSGILLTGGVRVNQTDPMSPVVMSSVEVYVPATKLSYSCPNLPQPRFGHTQQSSHYCGHFSLLEDWPYCYRFSQGSWQSSINLTQLMMMGTSFDSSAGFVLLGALDFQTSSTQAVLVEGVKEPKPLFNLTSLAYSACSVTDYDTDSVIVIGGSPGGAEGFGDPNVNTSVVRYNLDGFVENLPYTNQPRVASACSSYKEGGETYILVAGGVPPTDPDCPQCLHSALSSVEILRIGSSAWEVSTPLPVPVLFASAITINNVIYLLGGLSNSNFEESQDIYEWQPSTKQWRFSATMLGKRSAFGISALDLESGMLDHCVAGNRGSAMFDDQVTSSLNRTMVDKIAGLYQG